MTILYVAVLVVLAYVCGRAYNSPAVKAPARTPRGTFTLVEDWLCMSCYHHEGFFPVQLDGEDLEVCNHCLHAKETTKA